jgi:hypothetical protein
MNAMKSALTALLAAFTLAACGERDANTKGGEAAPSTGNVTLSSAEHLPDWLLVARQRDCAADAPPAERCPLGEVHFNQRTITRTTDGFADIWVQTRHGQPQLFQYETESTRTTVRFEVQRLHYRFNCNTREFVVVERHILGANEAVVARDEPRQIYRAPLRGSITHIILPIACRGS